METFPFLKVGRFIHTCYPTRSGILTVNFGDGGLHAGGTRAIKMLLANGFDGKGRAYVRRLELT